MAADLRRPQQRLSQRYRRLRFTCWLACIVVGYYFLLHRDERPLGRESRAAPRWSLARSTASTDSRDQDIALIFDSNRLTYAAGVIRSAHAFKDDSTRLHFHLVTTDEAFAELGPLVQSLGVGAQHYDFDACHDLTASLRPFANPDIHTSALCKLFLAELLPKVERVLYLDTDATVVAPLAACQPQFEGDALFAMAIDMGDACQLRPERCWPLSLDFVPWDGLVCGNVPSRHWPDSFDSPDVRCTAPREPEPAQVNGGVVFMDLARMRQTGFIRALLRATAYNFLLAGRHRAKWAEQEFLNAFIRQYPATFQLLPCGCNYQYIGIRREVKCANQPIYVTHSWSSDAARDTDDPYNHLFHYFERGALGAAPVFPAVSASAVGSPSGPVNVSINVNCINQPYDCSGPLFPAEFGWGDPVFVLTRTAGRPKFFAAARKSVLDQTYPNIQHIIITDDAPSMSYLTDTPAELVKSSSVAFDPQAVCRECQHLSEGAKTCGQAPGPGKPGRQAFFDCYCNSSYPMNSLVNNLFDRVKTMVAKSGAGWIIILDDDNIFTSNTAVSDIMLEARHHDQLVLFQSKLGRMTPLVDNVNKSYVTRGDIDASNYMFHTSHIDLARWTDKRCADWRSVDKLSRHLSIRWSPHIPIQAHPQRAQYGGMGAKADLAGGP